MESIWSDTVQLPHFPALEEEIHTDVLVVGGGMAGLLCALKLQRAGVDCVVAEAKTIAGGITKNTTAKITAQHGLIYQKLLSRFGTERTALYWQANQDALEAFRSLCAGLDCDFLEQDHFVYARDELQALENECSALEAIGHPAPLVQQLPLRFPTAGAVKFSHQAQFHPLKFLASIAQGLTIYENTPVQEIENGFAATPKARIHADSIIVATHFPFLNKHGSYFLKLYQHRSYVLGLENVPKLEGMYLDASGRGLSFRGCDALLLLGGGSHRTGKAGGGWRELEAFARDHYPGARCRYRWAAQDCMSLDEIPYVGRYSRRTPDLYVATGFNKWGMTSAMMAASILTDLVQGKDNPYAEVFSPSRSILRPQLGINALEAAANLLTPTKKRCPHLGCALKWNPQEHSWDCPCHGSRFTAEGILIDNPANGDLRPES